MSSRSRRTRWMLVVTNGVDHVLIHGLAEVVWFQAGNRISRIADPGEARQLVSKEGRYCKFLLAEHVILSSNDSHEYEPAIEDNIPPHGSLLVRMHQRLRRSPYQQ